MVRRGSTVRVRQRALQNPRSRGFSVQGDLLFVARAVGMEPFMELSRTRLDNFRAKEEVAGPEARVHPTSFGRWTLQDIEPLSAVGRADDPWPARLEQLT